MGSSSNISLSTGPLVAVDAAIMCLNVMTFKLRFIFTISDKYLRQVSTRDATSLWASAVVISHCQEAEKKGML